MGLNTAAALSPQAHSMTDQEKIAWLRLIRTKNVGPITFYELLRRFETASQALLEISRLAQRGGARDLIFPCSEQDALREWDQTHAYGAQILFKEDVAFPQALLSLPDCPPVLTVKGNLNALNALTIGIVGARNASLNGKKFAEKLGRELGQNGYIIASGLARGIDTYAHRGSLTTGTIAVVAGGINVIYPEENADLYKAIQEGGVIVAESPFGVDPQSHFFPKRNRLISGLSRGVVVVEAAMKSGSLITAQYALEQNREVFAVPGSPLDPRCRGTNTLIRQGATLIQDTSDILEGLPMQIFGVAEEPALPYERPFPENKAFSQISKTRNLNYNPSTVFGVQTLDSIPRVEQQERIRIREDCETSQISKTRNLNYEDCRENLLINLSYTPTSIDELVRLSLGSPADVLAILLEMELAGRIQRHSGNKVALIEQETET